MRSTIGKAAVVVVACVLLSGCLLAHFGAAPLAGRNLPEAPKRLTDMGWCGRGDAKAGDDAIVAARRKEDARSCEYGRVKAWNTFYGELMTGN